MEYSREELNYHAQLEYKRDRSFNAKKWILGILSAIALIAFIEIELYFMVPVMGLCIMFSLIVTRK